MIIELQANTTSLYLFWKEPADNNAPILMYRIMLQAVEDEIRNASESESESAMYISNTTDSELYVDGLTPFTLYSVQVVAVNGIGSSAPSEPMTVMTAEGGECVCLTHSHVHSWLVAVCCYYCIYSVHKFIIYYSLSIHYTSVTCKLYYIIT